MVLIGATNCPFADGASFVVGVCGARSQQTGMVVPAETHCKTCKTSCGG